VKKEASKVSALPVIFKKTIQKKQSSKRKNQKAVFLKTGYARSWRLHNGGASANFAPRRQIHVKAPISRLGANFFRRRENPFKKLTSGHPARGQGCQMVCFQTKNPNLGKFLRALHGKMLVYFMYGHLEYFKDIWEIQ
jgi:hypothetical protein